MLKNVAAPLLSALLISSAARAALNYEAMLLHPTGATESAASGNSSNSQVGRVTAPSTGGTSHAVRWTSVANTYIDLHPVDFDHSSALAANDDNQVGFAVSNDTTQAVLWSGTAASAINLHPEGFASTQANAVVPGAQFGSGLGPITANHHHALMWHSTAASVVDLHPAGFTNSTIASTFGNSQVGSGASAATGAAHALLWHGAANDYVDLHNAAFQTSSANGIWENNQVGIGFDPSPIVKRHALLWHGTAASMIDLHPTDFSFSETTAVSTNAVAQVGYGTNYFPNFGDEALLWQGSAASIQNLHQLLAGLGHDFIGSQALSISANGDITGYAYDANGVQYAVLWKIAASGVPGDYNNNSTVDTADYVFWRNGSKIEYNEVATLGSNTAADYTAWRARFGNTAGSGSAQPAAVPEPASAYACICALITCGFFPISAPRRR